jgi:hypothetical protein
MYVLNQDDFRAVDTNCIVRFVECWERYYRGEDPEYFAALNLGNDLTEKSITRLLRWEDPRFLTHPKKAGGEPNRHVTRVLERKVEINRFRNGDLTADDFGGITQKLFPTGFIWQLFLFHLARPTDWPIADRNVFRSYSVLFNATVPASINSFRAYAETCQKLAATFRSSIGINDADLGRVVTANKRLDNALVAFGQFLSKYDVDSLTPPQPSL